MEVTQLPGLSGLLAEFAEQQTASPVAVPPAQFGRIGAGLRLLEPLDGAFNGSTAVLLARWSAQRWSDQDTGPMDE